MSFLNAEWRKLAIVNYEIAPEVLAKYVPATTEVDLWNNKCFVSVVGFMFLNTKILGLKIPFHVNFEEVNLRFYVRHLHNNEWRRGVVFIKEIVPKHAITLVANTVYGEHYETQKMKNKWVLQDNELKVSYEWGKKHFDNEIAITANSTPVLIEEESDIEFITEHYWGYTQNTKGICTEYEVTHPKWLHYPVSDYTISIQFEELYGKGFSFLENTPPHSVILAEGSEITVESKRNL